MRILLADDQPSVRFALRAMLERLPDLEVIGEAVDAATLLAQMEKATPDLLLLAWPLAGKPPADLFPALRRVRPHLPVIVLSGRPEARNAALQAGASAFVYKGDPPEVLLAAIVDCWCGQQGDLPGTRPQAQSPEGQITHHL
jgi:DNA-binding NarL/FixJ family response regulator